MADKKFSIEFDASMNIQQMKQAAAQIQTEFNKLQLSAGTQKSFNNLFSRLENQIKDFQAKTESGIGSIADFKAIDKSGKRIIELFSKLKVEAKSLTNLSESDLLKLFPETLGPAFKTANKDLKDFSKKLDEATGKAKNLSSQIEQAKKRKAEIESRDPAKGKKQISNYEYSELSSKKKKNKDDRRKVQTEIDKNQELIKQKIEEGTLKYTKNGSIDKRYGNADDKDLVKRTEELIARKKELDETSEKLYEEINNVISVDQVEKNKAKIEETLSGITSEIEGYTKKLNELASDPNFSETFNKIANDLKELTGVDFSQFPQTAEILEQMQNSLENFKSNQIKKAKEEADDFAEATKEAADVTDNLGDELDNLGNKTSGMNRATSDINHLKDSILDFFSVSNAIQLFKNAIHDAFDTVKELDKAMTETAVVTDYSVGDMWESLPKYTDLANKLGATTLGAYQTMTLFYQQGLDTNEAMEVGAETMKMARIAGLDYAKATDLMTAALRGFNMELNEDSAQRVNDVYSKLAAITAADTEEIAHAMTKTASIAHSANMEFETTTAFLSQIVETTRESAETAGTAMKTVIARFQELKKSPDEIGEVDGEIVDANKIESALRSVGVALRDSEGQFRDLDDVFLELASKWDGLDRNTQRYIATIAAGSRQQSRFLAMMSDYDRTMELVSAANNSAGASADQFAKTTDSLESKLNKLQNAWDQFTMGLADNEIIKFVVDQLTNVVNLINQITDALPGATSAFAKLGIAVVGLKGGSALFNTFIESSKTVWANAGDKGAKAFTTVFKESLKEKSKKFFKEDIPTFSKKLKNVFNLSKYTEGINSAGKGFDIKSFGKNLLGLIGPLGKILIVLTAIVAIVKFTKKYTKEHSLEGKLESAKEATENAKKSAENAKKAYDELLGKKNQYDETQKKLENLTKGTEEWKQALAESNLEVMELLNKYSQLTAVRGKNGQLTIDSSSWNKLLKQQEKSLGNANALVSANQIISTGISSKISEKETKKAFKILPNKKIQTIDESEAIGHADTNGATSSIKAQVGYDQVGYNKELYDNLLKIYQEGTSEDLKAFDDLAIKAGYSTKEIQKMKDAMSEYNKTINESNSLIQSQSEMILSQKASQETRNYEYSDNLFSVFGKDIVNNLNAQKITKRAESIYLSNGKSEYLNNDNFKNLVEDQHIDVLMTGNDAEDVKTLYAAMANIDISEIPESLAKDTKAMAREIAKIDMSNEITSKMETFREKVSKEITKDQQKVLFSLLNGNGTNLNINEVESLEDIDSFLQQLEYTFDELATELSYENTTYNQLTNEQKQAYLDKYKVSKSQLAGNEQISGAELLEFDLKINKKSIEDQKKTIKEALESKGIETKDLEYDLGTLEGINNQIANFGKEDAQIYMDNFNKVVSQSDDKMAKNYLSTINWSNLEEANEALDYLRSQHVDTSVIDNFWKSAVDGANAYCNSLEAAANLIKNTQNAMRKSKDVQERLANGTATEEDISFLESYGIVLKGKLQETAEGWKMSDSDIQQIGSQLGYAIADSAQKRVEAQRDTYNEVQAKFNDKSSYLPKAVTYNEETAQYEGINFKDIQNPDLLAEELLGRKRNYLNESDEEYLSKAEEKYNEIINILNTGEATLEMLQQDAQFANAAKYTDDEARNQGMDSQTQIYAAQNEAIKWNIPTKDLANYAKQLKKTADLTDEMATSIAKDNLIMSKALDQLVNKWKEWEQILKNPNSAKYASTLKELQEVLKGVLGITEDLPEEFVTSAKALELISKAAEGDTNAIELLRKESAKSILLNIDFQDDELNTARNEIISLFNEFDGTGFTVGANLDNEPFIKALNELLAANATAAPQIQKFLEAAGVEVTYETVKYPKLEFSDGTKGPKGMFLGYTSTEVRVPHITHAKWKGPITSTYTPSAPTSKGGGGAKEKEDWANPYDQLYSQVQELNQVLREREKIERRYQRILESEGVSGKKIIENNEKEIQKLKEQSVLQRQMAANRMKQIEAYMSWNPDMQKYGGYKDGRMWMNWDEVNKITDLELGKKIEKYFSDMEEKVSALDEVKDALEDNLDLLQDFKDRGKDEYFNFEQTVKDAVLNHYQKQIDKLSVINDSINDTNTKLLDAVQKEIDKYRQDRNNEKTEKDLSDKQTQIEYLMQDTSGANDLAILQLQDEIAQGQQDYTDQLVDQKISELQQQNEDAFAQREREIAIAQAQLEHYEHSGQIWEEVRHLIDEGVSEEETLLKGSQLDLWLREQAGFGDMSSMEQREWFSKMDQMISAAQGWINNQNQNMQDIFDEIQNNSNLNDNPINHEQEHTVEPVKPQQPENKPSNSGNSSNESSGGTSGGHTIPERQDVKDLQGILNNFFNANLGQPDGRYGPATKAAVKKMQKTIGTSADGYYGKNTANALKNYLWNNYHISGGIPNAIKFKKGGLANFTGPAWLDGTKSHPEMVLNARDTENFIQLKDILSHLLKNSSTVQSTENYGDNTYDIDINVESMNSDYDVEQMANKVKSMLNETATYRNNNTINLQR